MSKTNKKYIRQATSYKVSHLLWKQVCFWKFHCKFSWLEMPLEPTKEAVRGNRAWYQWSHLIYLLQMFHIETDLGEKETQQNII